MYSCDHFEQHNNHTINQSTPIKLYKVKKFSKNGFIQCFLRATDL